MDRGSDLFTYVDVVNCYIRNCMQAWQDPHIVKALMQLWKVHLLIRNAPLETPEGIGHPLSIMVHRSTY